MFRTLRVPLLRIRPAALPLAFRRPLAVAAQETYSDSTSTSLPPKQPTTYPFLENEPKKPNIITAIPGPKSQAAKDAMGKIQDV